MSKFIQLHILTHYPPSNPNRDDNGNPKTAMYGGALRARMSSQSIKRALRSSSVFQERMAGNIGVRSRRIGETLVDRLMGAGIDQETAEKAARDVIGALGASSKQGVTLENLVFISKEEEDRAYDIALEVASGKAVDTKKLTAEAIFLNADTAVDIAMFGRMLASSPQFNRDAACQVSHAITVNKVESEVDFYTAVDDLSGDGEAKSAFLGSAGFTSGVYYIYAAIDVAKLIANLNGDAKLAQKAVAAFIAALATSAPSGKRASFANHVTPDFLLCDTGSTQPINLMSAFDTPIRGAGLMTEAVRALQEKREAFGKAYPETASKDGIVLHVGQKASSSLEEVCTFAANSVVAG